MDEIPADFMDLFLKFLIAKHKLPSSFFSPQNFWSPADYLYKNNNRIPSPTQLSSVIHILLSGNNKLRFQHDILSLISGLCPEKLFSENEEERHRYLLVKEAFPDKKKVSLLCHCLHYLSSFTNLPLEVQLAFPDCVDLSKFSLADPLCLQKLKKLISQKISLECPLRILQFHYEQAQMIPDYLEENIGVN